MVVSDEESILRREPRMLRSPFFGFSSILFLHLQAVTRQQSVPWEWISLARIYYNIKYKSVTHTIGSTALWRKRLVTGVELAGPHPIETRNPRRYRNIGVGTAPRPRCSYTDQYWYEFENVRTRLAIAQGQLGRSCLESRRNKRQTNTLEEV